MIGWIGDAAAFDVADDHHEYRGDHWDSDGGDKTYPEVTRPIGFDLGWNKPRVRVKAWTQPVWEGTR